MSFKSRLSQAVHGEGTTAQMPLDQEPLTAEEIQKIDQWIDFFCLISTAENGAWSDSVPPTLFVSRSGELKIGAFDYLSGLSSVTVNGDPASLTDDVWTGPTLKQGDEYTVIATDNAGNQTKIERFVRGESIPVPPDCAAEIAELKARILILETESAKQKAKLERIAEIVNE
jgi:hypothetical protein